MNINPLVGEIQAVILGVIIALLILIRRISFPRTTRLGGDPEAGRLVDTERNPSAEPLPGVIVYRFEAPLIYSNAQAFSREALSLVAADRAAETLIVDAEVISDIDTTGAESLSLLVAQLRDAGIRGEVGPRPSFRSGKAQGRRPHRRDRGGLVLPHPRRRIAGCAMTRRFRCRDCPRRRSSQTLRHLTGTAPSSTRRRGSSLFVFDTAVGPEDDPGVGPAQKRACCPTRRSPDVPDSGTLVRGDARLIAGLGGAAVGGHACCC